MPGLTVGSRALTGLRGVAALFVVFHHLYLGQHVQLPFIDNFARRGYLAVDLFFVLSGFVMALAYGNWFATSWDPARYAAFMARRVARLWPLQTAVILAVLGGSALAHHGSCAVSWGAAFWAGPIWPKMVAANLLMVQSWGWSQVIVSPSWSVSTEMLAYTLFPVLAAAALHGRRRTAWVTAGIAALTLIACILLAPSRGIGRRGVLDIYDNWSVLPPLRCLAGFSLGLLSWRALRDPRVAEITRQPGMAVVGGGGVLLLLATGAPDLAVYALLPVLVASLFTGAGPLQRALARRLPYQAGVLSYAIYLVHVPVLGFVQRLVGPDPVVLLPVFLVTMAAVAVASHVLIERPCQTLLRRALTVPGGLLERCIGTFRVIAGQISKR